MPDLLAALKAGQPGFLLPLLPRRSREVTHLCSDRVTHAENRPCPWARSESGDFIRAEGAQGLCIPPTSQSPGRPCHPVCALASRQVTVLVGHFSRADLGNISRAPK